MSEIVKISAPYPITQAPIDPELCRDSIAGESLYFADTCYEGEDGKTYKCLGVADSPSDRVKGQILWGAAAGEPTRYVAGVRWQYTSGLTRGADIYLSASVPGGLATTPPYFGAPPVGSAFSDSQISFYPPGAIATDTGGSVPLTPPPGCKLFDSFGRRNQTYASDLIPSLGSTENTDSVPSLGSVSWTQGFAGAATQDMPVPWGLFGGFATPVLDEVVIGSAWVNTGSATQDVQVKGPTPASFEPGCTSLTIRQQDKDNFIAVVYQPNSFTDYSGGGTVFVFQVSAGIWGDASLYAVASGNIGWIRATAAGTTLTFYASNDGSTWVQVGQQTGVTFMQTATNAGFVAGAISVTGMGHIRINRFMCF